MDEIAAGIELSVAKRCFVMSKKAGAVDSITLTGFMLRVSSSNDRESVRVAAEALNEGLNFTAIGNAILRALHLHKEVEAVRIIFITDPKVDYGRLQDGLKKTKQITATIDHMLKDVNMDCGSCGLQEICDEIEGLREMHFGMSEEHT